MFCQNIIYCVSLRPKPEASEGFHYTDFDCKVMDYMGRLKREDMVKNYVSQTRTIRYYLVWGIVQ